MLTRAERIATLIEEEKFDPETDSPFGLPKVKVKQSRAGSKAKKAAKEDEEGAEGEATAETAAE